MGDSSHHTLAAAWKGCLCGCLLAHSQAHVGHSQSSDYFSEASSPDSFSRSISSTNVSELGLKTIWESWKMLKCWAVSVQLVVSENVCQSVLPSDWLNVLTACRVAPDSCMLHLFLWRMWQHGTSEQVLPGCEGHSLHTATHAGLTVHSWQLWQPPSLVPSPSCVVFMYMLEVTQTVPSKMSWLTALSSSSSSSPCNMQCLCNCPCQGQTV